MQPFQNIKIKTKDRIGADGRDAQAITSPYSFPGGAFIRLYLMWPLQSFLRNHVSIMAPPDKQVQGRGWVGAGENFHKNASFPGCSSIKETQLIWETA